jgi:hypothetical protein
MYDFDPSRYDFDPRNTGSQLQTKFQATRAVDQPGVKRGRGNRGPQIIDVGAPGPEYSPSGRGPGEISLGGSNAEELLSKIRQTISAEGFALGGLVGMPPIRFAEGGLVGGGASGGRPVHLHLGSSSFALSGSSGVVDALISHAHSQQIRSAGVKPSWFAGPSGR